jgi:hypothetical protein
MAHTVFLLSGTVLKEKSSHFMHALGLANLGVIHISPLGVEAV